MKTIDLVARALAFGDESEQADFLNAFVSELIVACKNRPNDQTWHVAKHLEHSTVEVLREMLATYDYRQEQARVDRHKLGDVRDMIREAEVELAEIRRQAEALRDGKESGDGEVE